MQTQHQITFHMVYVYSRLYKCLAYTSIYIVISTSCFHCKGYALIAMLAMDYKPPTRHVMALYWELEWWMNVTSDHTIPWYAYYIFGMVWRSLRINFSTYSYNYVFHLCTAVLQISPYMIFHPKHSRLPGPPHK